MAFNIKIIRRVVTSSVIILISLIVWIGCQQEINVPSDLIGVWQTAAPEYKDRYIEFTKKELLFGLGGEEKKIHTITKIEWEQQSTYRLYSFYYRDMRGEPWTLSLKYNPLYNDGVFRIKNSEEIWKR